MEHIDTKPPLDEGFLVIDPGQINNETLRILAKEFILRESGNDFVDDQTILDQLEHALRRIRTKELLITFNSHDQSVGIAPAIQLLQ